MPHARTLFADSVVVPVFPFQAQTDSVRAAWAGAKYPPEPHVEFTALLDDGREVGLAEYADQLRAELPEGPRCFVGVTVEWDGTISAARVMTCRMGNIPDDLLVPTVRRLRAEVVDYGVGRFPVQWSLAFPLRRRP